jgi:NADH-quinone oxidoreductase subunit J
VFAFMTLAGGILTISVRNAVHCAVWLIVSLLGTAGLFLLQKAEFLFAVQIILYIGGIMVLFLL